jgi:membrane-associated phospholipid phosphatase
MIPVAGAALYFFRKRKHFLRFLTAVSIAFYLSYISFIIFPVRGPRYEFYDKYTKDYTVNIGRHYGPHVDSGLKGKETRALKGYFVTRLQDYIMKYGSMHGGCMPSSHISVAFVSMVMMAFYVRKLFYIYLPSVALLCVSVVYNRYHYLSDVPAGIIVGIIAIYLADAAIKKYNNEPPRKVSPG